MLTLLDWLSSFGNPRRPHARYRATWPTGGVPSLALTPIPVAASSQCQLQAAGEYRRYLADWWGDAIKAEFEERKHEAG